MESGGLDRLDERGLMPLAEARAWLDARDAYVKGDFLPTTGARSVLESDRTWAAVLSLTDGDEFLAVTGRLSWEFQVRGMDNLAALERYGDAVLGWVEQRTDSDGVLHNTPWCLLPCLLACPAAAAFDVAAKIHSVVPATTGVRSVLGRWVLAHPDPGYRLLATHIQASPDGADGATALAAIEELFAADPRGTAQSVGVAIGDEPATQLLTDLGLTAAEIPADVAAALRSAPQIALAPSTPVSIAELDDCFADFETPLWDNANYFCAAMRLTGFVTPGGCDGIVYQQLMTGLGTNDIRLEFATFGFGTPSGIRWAAMRPIVNEDFTGAIRWHEPVTLPLINGPCLLTPVPDPEFASDFGPMETVMLRATDDQAGRDRTFLTPQQLVEQLGLPAETQALFALDIFEQPAAGDPASSSPDLVLAVEALRDRRAITASLTGCSREEQLRDRIERLGGWGGP